jgi:hypothetical protein
MSTTAYVHLTLAATIECHDGPGAPYLSIYPDGPRGEQLLIFLGHGGAPNELDIAARQLIDLSVAIRKAYQLIEAARRAMTLPPDEPTDEPTDEPHYRPAPLDWDARRDLIGRGTGDPLAAGDHYAYPKPTDGGR